MAMPKSRLTETPRYQADEYAGTSSRRRRVGVGFSSNRGFAVNSGAGTFTSTTSGACFTASKVARLSAVSGPLKVNRNVRR